MAVRTRFDNQRKASTTARMRKQPLTGADVLQRKHEADTRWNTWASKHKEQRERYEHKFEVYCLIKDPYTKKNALEHLCLSEERNIFLAGARLWSDVYYWNEMAAIYQVDKKIIDVELNQVEHWWKVLMGRDDSAHHEYDPVRGKVFLPKAAKGNAAKGQPSRAPRFHPSTGEAKQAPLGSYKIIDRRGV